MYNKTIKAERLMDEGIEVVEVKIPALLTVVKEINEPRIESLKGKMRAKAYQYQVWNANDINCNKDQIGLKGSQTWVNKIFVPVRCSKKEMIEGSTIEEKVDILVSKIKNTSLVC